MKINEQIDEQDDLEYQLYTPKYLGKCQYGINVVELKLKMLDDELSDEKHRVVISTISSRLKSPDSVRRKLQKKRLEVSAKTARDRLNDIAGVRVTCFFEDDIYELVERISQHEDIVVVKEKDYIRKPKSNGYKSFHLIVDVPV